MSSYDEHLISMAGGDGESRASENMAKPCDRCGKGVGEYKASAWRRDKGERFFCHNDERSCYNEARGRYFEEPTP